MEQRQGQSIEDEAIQWFVILRDEDCTEEDRRRFYIWRMSDPQHDVAWHDVVRVWGGLDYLSDHHAVVAESAKIPILKSPVAVHSFSQKLLTLKNVALTASLVFAALLGWQLIPVGLMADYRTSVGEKQVIRLEDGSEIELATASAIDVDLNGETRNVKLLAGEAFFTIAKDPQRPFVVHAGNGQVQVLGTAFNVRIDDTVTVAVTHNTVEVSTDNSALVRVTEGEMVQFDDKGMTEVQEANLDTIQAWRQGQIVFENAPLDQVIAELQRDHRGRLQLLSDDAGKLRVTAVFDTHRSDAALDMIAESLNLRVFRVTNLLIGIAQK